MNTAPERSTLKIEARVAAALCYSFGLVTGLLFLVLERDHRDVRFHAMQSTIFFAGVAIAYMMILGLPIFGRVLVLPFILGVAAVWVWLLYQAFQGGRYKLPYVGDWAESQLR